MLPHVDTTTFNRNVERWNRDNDLSTICTNEKKSCTTPSLTGSRRGRSDDLDDLLTAFFRQEMPESWPECPVPPEAEIASTLPFAAPEKKKQKRRRQWHSRLALAASVAFFLLATWALMGTGPEGTPVVGKSGLKIDGGTALPFGDHPRFHKKKGTTGRIREESVELVPGEKKDQPRANYRIIVEGGQLP